MKIWHRTGLYPYHQGLIFDDLSLSGLCGQTLLYKLGIRNNSLVRLVVITRSGPLALAVPEKLSAVPCSVQAEQSVLFLSVFHVMYVVYVLVMWYDT